MIKLTVDSVYKINEDFENVFVALSGINIKPKNTELKLSSRSVSSIRYDDVYIIEPKSYYYISFKEDTRDYFFSIFPTLYEIGLLCQADLSNNRVFIYNATENILYIQDKAEIGRAFYYEVPE